MMMRHMSTNPVLNALAASVYITAIVSFLSYMPKLVGPSEGIIVPIMMLSLFVFSAATMGYLFLAKPVELYLDGKRKEGVSLFLKTLFSFGAITLLVVVGVFASAYV